MERRWLYSVMGNWTLGDEGLFGVGALKDGEVAFLCVGKADVLHSSSNDTVGFRGVVHADEASSEAGGLYQRTAATRVAVHDSIARIGGGEDDALEHGGVLLSGVEGTLGVLVLPYVLGHLALSFVGVVDLAGVAGDAPVDEAGVVKFL